MSNPFAALVYAKDIDTGLMALTTRHKGDVSPIGLPGGKVEEGETSRQAAWRECLEEGWKPLCKGPEGLVYVMSKFIEKGRIDFFSCPDGMKKLTEYVEKGTDVKPVSVSIEDSDDSLRAFGDTPQLVKSIGRRDSIINKWI